MGIIGRLNNSSDDLDSSPPAVLVRVGANGQSYPLGSQAIVGRLDSCDVPINDGSVSREHARLSETNDGYTVEDLGSTNGTMINGEVVHGVLPVKPGDMLTFGSVEFRLELDDAQGVSFPPLQPMETSGATAVFQTRDDPDFTPSSTTPWPAQAEASPENHDVRGHDDPLPYDLRPHSAPVQPPSVPAASAAQPVVQTPRHDFEGVNEVMDEAREATWRLNKLVEGLVQQLAEAREQMEEMESQLREAQSHSGHHTTALREALGDIPERLVSGSEIGALRQILEELAHYPRDIELLMKLGQHTTAISSLISEYPKLRRVVTDMQEALHQDT